MYNLNDILDVVTESTHEDISESIITEKAGLLRTLVDDTKIDSEKEPEYLNLNTIKKIVKKIHTHITTKKYDNNCQLSASCFEMQMRHIDMVPRGIETPRDVVFKSDKNWSFIKNNKKIKATKDLKKFVNDTVLKAGNGSRFYAHTGWVDSTGGHVFNVLNIDNAVYIVDCTENLVKPLSSDKFYFDPKSSDYKRCYLIRADKSKINKKKMKYNDSEYQISWKDGDEKYLQ